MDERPDYREEAENRLTRESNPEMPPPAELPRVLHELRVHQVELELQNDELRNTQGSLEESRAKYADLYDSAPIGFLSLNSAGLILDANLAASSWLGIPRESLRRRAFASFVVDEDRHVFSSHVTKALDSPHVRVVDEIRILARGPAPEAHFLFHVRLESLAGFDALTGQPMCRTALVDITERIHAETALKDSEERFRLLVTDVTDYAMFLLDIQGRVMSWNNGAERMTGYSEEEILGTPIASLCELESRSDVDVALQTALQDGRAEITGWFLRKSQNPFWAATSLSKLSGSRKPGLGFAVVVHDVSDQRRIDEERLKTSRLESVALLAGGIAHDFNNLLTTIVGNISLARLSVEPNQIASVRLGEAEKACDRAKSLTQQLLTFASGGAPVRSIVAIGPLLQEWVTFSLRGSTILPKIDVSPDLWLAEIDSAQISQVMNNIVINAQQAMPMGGSLALEARNLTLRKAKGGLPPGPYLKISLTDTGPGIPPEILPKIFDPFFTTKAHGTGLGLTTAYSIVKRHHGRIDVHSSRHGATFDVFLPALPKAEPPAHVSGPAELTSGTGKILIMDDDTTIGELFVLLVNKLGYEAECVADGAIATVRYQEAKEAGKPFDVVVLDLTVPGGTGGVETITRLRLLDPDVKALVSSGYATDPVLANYREYGFCGVLSKPYSPEELSAVLRQILTTKTSSQ